MSRSYRKNPILKDGGNSSKSKKRVANQTVRRQYLDTDFPVKGNYYKKLFPQYDINDFIYYWSLEEAIVEYNSEEEEGWRHQKYPNLDAYLAHWYKLVLRK